MAVALGDAPEIARVIIRGRPGAMSSLRMILDAESDNRQNSGSRII
jgi:hypothetical protein